MRLTINDQPFEVPDAPDRPLLWVLRDELGLTGTRYGCGIGQCGSCTVHLDGKATRACITPLSAVADAPITTIEGLADGEVLHPVQRAFLDHQVPQCGWCMSGQIMTAAAFLEAQGRTTPSAEEIDAALEGNLCRCGCYARIKTAVAEAATSMVAARDGRDGRGDQGGRRATSGRPEVDLESGARS
jgi:isoquinoline 1-oxidoreductase alpha subunit